ncbi:hypothetical protein MLD38_032048 [Melastoma candidum]|uniref:Uncharacterized protein n=1 Tax=Melastoma candidum TaxID=119954 RepID=A0ACB9M2W8_9MYRT|nr:hypothetical protein MLD38_032048 [Melastoma candidum]
MDAAFEFDSAFPPLGGSAVKAQVGSSLNARRQDPVGGNSVRKEGLSFKSALNAWGNDGSKQHTVAFNEKGKLKVPVEWKEGAKSKWGSCIVGFMIGKHVDPSIIRRVCTQIWGKRGLSQVSVVGHKRILLRFEKEQQMEAILSRSDWHIAGCPVLLRKWSVGLQLSDKELRNVPCWVQLTGIPLELWHREGILYLASVLGVPIKLDGRSERPANMGTARVQINCAAVNELRKTIDIEGEEGEGIQVEVYYENIPLQCQHCKVFGHSTGQCLENNGNRKGRSRSRANRRKRSNTVSVEREHGGDRSKSVQLENCALEWRQMGVQEKGESSSGLDGVNRLETGPVPLRFNGSENILQDMPITISKELIGEEFNCHNAWSLVPYQPSETNYFEALEEEALADASGEESINEPSKLAGELEGLSENASIRSDEQQVDVRPLLLMRAEDSLCSPTNEEQLESLYNRNWAVYRQHMNGQPDIEFRKCLDSHQRASLSREVNDEEIKNTLFELKRGLGDLRALVTIEAMANSRIEPAATVADVLAGRDWDDFCRGKLRTASFWHNIGVISAGPVICLMCNEDDETVNHVLFQCPYARRVWRVLTKEYEFSFYGTTWEDLEGTMTQIWKTQKGRVIVRAYMAAIYYIWIERCRRRNGEIAISPWSVTLRVRAAVLR